jgi:PmbA protein
MNESTVFRSFLPESLEARLQAGIRAALALGADGAEAYVTVSRSRRAKVQNGVLEDLTTSKRGGLGVRVLRGSPAGVRIGIATTTDLTRADFRDLFAQAWELSALGDADPWVRQAAPEGVDDLPERYDPRGAALTPDDRIRRALELEAHARQASSRIVAVRESSWADGDGASLLLTQKGVRAYDLGSSCSGAIELAVAEGEDRQASWHWDMARHPGGVDLAAIGREAAQKGERKLRPAQMEAGRYSVVLHPEVAVDLLGIVAGMLSAEAVLKQRSLFAGKVGEAIASPLLTLACPPGATSSSRTGSWPPTSTPSRPPRRWASPPPAPPGAAPAAIPASPPSTSSRPRATRPRTSSTAWPARASSSPSSWACTRWIPSPGT